MAGVTHAELGNLTVGIQIESFFQEMANNAVKERKKERQAEMEKNGGGGQPG